jgi:single-stranded-DNA-specific exonuclease
MPSWEIQPVDENVISELSRSLLISALQSRLLCTRGIARSDEAERFLSPSMEHLHDPFLFREMNVAAAVLHEAVTSGERILIHGDYDADGVCGAALLYEALRKMGADVHYFIPDRAKDGYGLAERVVERGLDRGLSLVVTVDCGSSDHRVVSLLAGAGVKVIITDHHETRHRIPEATAFLNPKLPGETYPFKELAGAGVAFKLLQGLEKTIGIGLSLEGLLDLVAIGTLGDYTMLRGENRTLVRLGLEMLEEWRRPGLRALRSVSSLPKAKFTARQICFTIVPRLNSPGRIGSARSVVGLLVSDDNGEANRIARDIEEKNRRRKLHDNRVTEEACYLADIILRRAEPSALVFSSSSWHEGVVGIGAARLAERYNVPSVLIAVKEGVGKGSARSAGMVNIKAVLEKCSSSLREFGGHREAGGFSISEEKIPEFQRMFEEAVEDLAEETTDHGVLHVDAEVTLGDCTLGFVSFIERLAPFGPGNQEPIFLLRDLKSVFRSLGAGIQATSPAESWTCWLTCARTAIWARRRVSFR